MLNNITLCYSAKHRDKTSRSHVQQYLEHGIRIKDTHRYSRIKSSMISMFKHTLNLDGACRDVELITGDLSLYLVPQYFVLLTATSEKTFNGFGLSIFHILTSASTHLLAKCICPWYINNHRIH
jgi:hypothetical protein